jgi:hypothetical protein
MQKIRGLRKRSIRGVAAANLALLANPRTGALRFAILILLES